MKTQEEVARQHAAGPINIYQIYREGYQDRELDDWDAFRREAAKDILHAIIRKKSTMCSHGEIVKEAIAFADELIKQLKEDKQ